MMATEHTMLLTEEGMQSGQSAEWIADSQFDYPGSGTGWRYLTLSKTNEFGEWREVVSLADSGTPLAYLECADDPHCRIGRDYVHPGYERRPCLQWHAPNDSGGLYVVEAEVAQIRSAAAAPLLVTVEADDSRLHEARIGYPATHRFRIVTQVAPNGFVRILFAANGVIDHGASLFYARLRAANASEIAAGPTCTGETLHNPGRERLHHLLETLNGSPMNQPQVEAMARDLFGEFKDSVPSFCEPFLTAHGEELLKIGRGWGHPRFYSIAVKEVQ
jgi:hypothetical protein